MIKRVSMRLSLWSMRFMIHFFSMKIVLWSLESYLKKRELFYFRNIPLKYFFHSYNNFRVTERSIEIPIVRYFIDTHKPSRVLEIGNVTKHYYDLFKDFKEKDTVDKYELAYDVINLDIADFNPDKRYDFIYSISTFEHMDSDGGRNPEYKGKPAGKFTSVAFENINRVLENILDKGGHFLLTIPLE